MHARCTYHSLLKSQHSLFNLISLFVYAVALSFFMATPGQAATKPQSTTKQEVRKAPAANTQNASSVTAARKAERVYYMEAQKALEKKQYARYRELLPNLRNYPLLPYLEYQDLGERLMGLPTKEVEQFFTRYPNSYVGERLRHRWLAGSPPVRLFSQLTIADTSSFSSSSPSWYLPIMETASSKVFAEPS